MTPIARRPGCTKVKVGVFVSAISVLGDTAANYSRCHGGGLDMVRHFALPLWATVTLPSSALIVSTLECGDGTAHGRLVAARPHRIRSLFGAGCLLVLGVSRAQTCPLAPVDPSRLPKVLAGAMLMRASDPDVVAFKSKLDRDDDGTPNAYHRGLKDARSDPGLDHICVGGSVLEFAGGRLRNRYAGGGSVGALGGIDPKTGTSRSLLCKRDYIAIRDAGFPACGPGALCMIWYGIAAEQRACGYRNQFGGPDDQRCGAPVRQRDAQGRPGDYYLTTTSLRRPQSPWDTRVQADYVNASRVPYIVLPGGVAPPGRVRWAVGDLAVVVWKGRTVYAVVGDSGPRDKLGEASRAALVGLHGGSAAPIPATDPATTVVFPGSAAVLGSRWPLTADVLATEGRKLVERAGGAAALARCPGLAGFTGL